MASLTSRIITFAVRRSRNKETFNALAQRLSHHQAKPCGPSKRQLKQFHIRNARINEHSVWTLSPKQTTSDRHLFYLHGGAYINGLGKPHWWFLCHLAKALNCSITIPEYPLAPHHTVDDAMECILPLYKSLAHTIGGNNLVLMGDSSGGGLCLSLAQQINQRGLPKADKIILLCPWLDVSMSNPAIAEIDPLDPMLGVEGLRATGKAFAGKHPTKSPMISPLYGPLNGLPPMWIFIGSNDVFLPDCKSLHALAEAEQTPVTLHEYEDMLHLFMMMPIPEAKQALAKIVSIIHQTPQTQRNPSPVQTAVI